MIRVLIVDDSVIIRKLLAGILEKDSRFEIAGFAANGLEAQRQNKALDPDIIVMDIYMPLLDGIEATRCIMREKPVPIVIFSTEDTARMGYTALEAGALDMARKPDSTMQSENYFKIFKDRLAVLAQKNRKAENASQVTPVTVKTGGNWQALLIGASTGGPVAVQKVLVGLKKDFPLPILVTQHIDGNFDAQYASWLAETTGLPVSLAENGIPLQPGHVYVAPANKHLRISPQTDSKTVYAALTDDPPVHFLRPAVDPLFESGAEILKDRCLAVLLTGMGNDGAAGCKKIVDAGGYTICQDERSCVVYGMPGAAVSMGGASSVLSLGDIGFTLRKMAGI
ncbi:MAG: chemotaxis-specific protein-glutamate methyltransferase CheB [Treponema sp.]|nr:chemotaxis-specific protein-glutamate methyltransferase CheB [Candidatus Treponema caballi]